jgi:hypothetical protein
VRYTGNHASRCGPSHPRSLADGIAVADDVPQGATGATIMLDASVAVTPRHAAIRRPIQGAVVADPLLQRIRSNTFNLLSSLGQRVVLASDVMQVLLQGGRRGRSRQLAHSGRVLSVIFRRQPGYSLG